MTAARSAAEPQAVLTGTVTYRERIALPPNARVEVRLEDVSQADAPADEIASQTIAANGKQVPIPFELRYLPKDIDSSHRYAVRASITSADGDLMFTTAMQYPVLTGGAADKNVEIVVQRAGGGARAAAPGASGGGADQGGCGGVAAGRHVATRRDSAARCDRAGGRRRPSLHGRVRRRKAVGPRALQPLHGRLRAAGARRAQESRRWPRR